MRPDRRRRAAMAPNPAARHRESEPSNREGRSVTGSRAVPIFAEANTIPAPESARDVGHLTWMQLVVQRTNTHSAAQMPNINLDDLRQFSVATATRVLGPRDARMARPVRAPGPQLGPRRHLPFRSPGIPQPRSANRVACLVQQAEPDSSGNPFRGQSANSDRYLVELQPPSTTMV